jgi:hypothetical protein
LGKWKSVAGLLFDQENLTFIVAYQTSSYNNEGSGTISAKKKGGNMSLII